jgi:hypothetical protein
MTIRLSQAFAAFRTAKIAELMENLNQELIPNFNAEVVHIEKKYEEDKMAHGETLAMHFKRAAVLDLKVKQQTFIRELDQELQDSLKARIALPEYKGELKVVMLESDKGKKAKEVWEALFCDGSSARVPKGLWIDYSAFQRI